LASDHGANPAVEAQDVCGSDIWIHYESAAYDFPSRWPWSNCKL